MSKLKLVEAVEKRLAENWTGAPTIGLNGKGSAPDDGSPFVLVRYPYNTAARLTFGTPGNNVYREEGGIRFLIHVPAYSGALVALGWADEIAALFRGKEFDGVQTFAPTSAVIDDGNDRANYFVVSFAVPYQLDTLG